jgi:hypothetical protein
MNKNYDDMWNEVSKLAEKYGLITSGYGGVLLVVHPAEQIKEKIGPYGSKAHGRKDCYVEDTKNEPNNTK